MTKEEIKAQIGLCVAQQGNQSGLAGLAEILNAIIDIMPTSIEIVDNLYSISPTKALSANQGFTLGQKIGDMTLLRTTATENLVLAINSLLSPRMFLETEPDFANHRLELGGRLQEFKNAVFGIYERVAIQYEDGFNRITYQVVAADDIEGYVYLLNTETMQIDYVEPVA